MDDAHPAPPVVRFVPDRRYTATAGAGAALALVLAFLSGDAPGRLLAAIAVAVLVAYVVGDLVFSPRLTVSAAGIAIRSPALRTTLPWAAVAGVRADVRSRHGLRSTTLEIDGGEVFAVFSRRALGADPQEAAELIRAFQPR